MRALAAFIRERTLRAVSWSARLGSRMPYAKHLFPMKTTFRHCLLLNYSMEPATLARSLPRGLIPDVVHSPEGPRAFVSVVVADLEAMRPGFLPRVLGADFTQVVYRAIVRAPNGERGVYFVRSDANDWLMSAAGSVFSNFHFHLADCVWSGRDSLRDAAERMLLRDEAASGSRPQVERRAWLATPSSEHGRDAHDDEFAFVLAPRVAGSPGTRPTESAGVRLAIDPRSASLVMPPTSVFAGLDVREAQRYFVELYAAFASWPEHDHWTAVRIDRTYWQVVAVAPHLAHSDYMEASSAFGPGEATLDSTFYVHALDYHWHSIDRQPFRATDGGATATTFYFDGACPVCAREIAHWRRLLAAAPGQTATAQLMLHDISTGDLGRLGAEFGVGLEEAMSRAHAIDDSGTLHTGVAAFVVAWAQLPRWRLLAALLRLPMAASIAEVAYGAWARARPVLRAHRPETARTSPGASCRIQPESGTGAGAAATACQHEGRGGGP